VRGGRFQLETPEVEEPGMLMTSMIDVIFILLAFFICVTELKKAKLDVNVPEVPAAEMSQPTVEEEPLVVEVTGEDRIYVNGVEAADDDGLAALLEAAARDAGGDPPVHLSGDKDARHGTITRVVSQLSRAGLRRIELVVEQGG
jgi:biopolymer transport protein TolR